MGSKHVVKIDLGDRSCSGVLIEPQILVTAAHCLVQNGITQSATSIQIYPPGVDISDSSVQAKGVAIFLPSGYKNSTGLIEPNDIAFVALNKKLGTGSNLKISDFEQVNSFIRDGVTMTSYGYGRLDRIKQTTTPQKFIAFPSKANSSSSSTNPNRTTVEFDSDERGSTCPGDSGGPTLAEVNGDLYLISIHSGGQGPCSNTITSSGGKSVSTIVGEYSSLYSQAQNYLKLNQPESVIDTKIVIANGQAKLQWQPSNRNQLAINQFSVADGANKEICITQTLSCQVELKPGENMFSVTSIIGELRSEPTTFTYNLELAKAENLKIIQDGFYATLVWSVNPKQINVPTGYLVYDSSDTELCNVSMNLSCRVSLRFGQNIFKVVSTFGKYRSEVALITFDLQNAKNIDSLGLDVKDGQVEIKVPSISDFNSARPESVRIKLYDGLFSSPICNLGAKGGSCFIDLQSKNYSFYASLSSNLGETDREKILDWSGTRTMTSISNTKKTLLTLNNDIQQAIKANPGYSLELSNLSRRLPKIVPNTIFNSDLDNSILLIKQEFESLKIQIRKFPKNVQVSCQKGNVVRIIKGVNPKCPKGFKLGVVSS